MVRTLSLGLGLEMVIAEVTNRKTRHFFASRRDTAVVFEATDRNLGQFLLNSSRVLVVTGTPVHGCL
ncbi:hypothetical protein HYQ46_006703 [Verticillium longisporum]|nr:hypothetical protein HYQ46_006703 [Verticillium longisporum]